MPTTEVSAVSERAKTVSAKVGRLTQLLTGSLSDEYDAPSVGRRPLGSSSSRWLWPTSPRRFSLEVGTLALHTTAAPSYYPGVDDDGYIMIDGGIWANNPIMNAVVDTLACFDVPRENVRALSLGTGEATFTVNEKARSGGAMDWAFMRSFNAAARAQSKNALGQAYLLLGKNNVVRIDVPESDKPIALDDVARSIREWPLVARSLVEGSGHHVQNLFLLDEADVFEKCNIY